MWVMVWVSDVVFNVVVEEGVCVLFMYCYGKVDFFMMNIDSICKMVE